MAPEETHQTLFKLHGNYLKLLTGIVTESISYSILSILETSSACNGGMKQLDRLTNIAYMFLNVTQIEDACEQLFSTTEDISVLSSFIANPSVITSFKCIIAKALLNVSYYLSRFRSSAGYISSSGMHPVLLSDQGIADIVDSFADEDDDITTEEMDSLPLQLQYVNHKRSQSTLLLDTLIEVLSRVIHSYWATTDCLVVHFKGGT